MWKLDEKYNEKRTVGTVMQLPSLGIRKSFEKLELPRGAYNYCVANGLFTVPDIIAHFSEKRGFKDADEWAKLALLRACLDSKDCFTDFSMVDFKSVIQCLSSDREKLVCGFIESSWKRLSIRSRNAVSGYLDYDMSLGNIMENILSRKFFDPREIKNVGLQATLEIRLYVEQLKKYILGLEALEPEEIELLGNEGDLAWSFVKGLNGLQTEIVDDYIVYLISKLGVRSGNALRLHLKNELSLKGFSEKVFVDGYDIMNIRNIGIGSVPELKDCIAKIIGFIIEIKQVEDLQELRRLKTELYLSNNFNIPTDIINQGLVFQIIDYSINHGALFNSQYCVVLKNGMNVYEGTKQNNREVVGQMVGRSSERVRQISHIVLEDIFDRLRILKQPGISLPDLDVEGDGNYIVISQQKANEINVKEDCAFSKEFIALVFAVFMEGEFKLIRSINNLLLFNETAHSHRWKNIYLAKEDLYEDFYFEKLIRDLLKRSARKNFVDYKIDFAAYLAGFSKTGNAALKEEFVAFCEMLIKEELNIELDGEKRMVYKRNTKVNLPEYVEELLEELGKPTSAEEIYSLMNERFPNVFKSADIIKSSCNRSKSITYFGNYSLYGLKRWETEQEDFKSGSIRALARDYLAAREYPVHRKELTDHVLKYRPETSRNNIMASLSTDEKVVLLKRSFVGLNSKDYGAFDFEFPGHYRFLWKDHYEYLLDFIDRNNRLPTYHSERRERNNYCWLWKQKILIENGLLDGLKAGLIKVVLVRVGMKVAV